MTGLDDLNQKVIIVVVFTIRLLLWWFVKSRFVVNHNSWTNRIKHLETRRLAHASVLSLFEVQGKTVLIVQGKQGSSSKLRAR